MGCHLIIPLNTVYTLRSVIAAFNPIEEMSAYYKKGLLENQVVKVKDCLLYTSDAADEERLV